MPIFASTDERFDDIEYFITSKPWGTRTMYKIVYKTSLGEDHDCPRLFDSPPTEKQVADELGFSMRYWREQLDDRNNAIVCEQTHYRHHGVVTSGRSVHRGFGGSTFRFRSLATGEELVSNDVWYQGPIPVWAASAFPDTHEQVTQS